MPPEPIITARALRVEHQRCRWFKRGATAVCALDGVDLEIAEGATVGLTGSSGCGKSTLARCLARLEKPTAGDIVSRAGVQLVMQDPSASLNPRFTAAEIVEEPLLLAGQPKARAMHLMQTVGLDPAHSARLSHNFSGGQKARLAIARAIAAVPPDAPGLLIFDESFGALDPQTRDQILAIMAALRPLSFLIISHDLAMLASVATRIVVMDRGRIVEQGEPRTLFTAPRHSQTARLVECTPEAL